jgi:hypothetical protein
MIRSSEEVEEAEEAEEEESEAAGETEREAFRARFVEGCVLPFEPFVASVRGRLLSRRLRFFSGSFPFPLPFPPTRVTTSSSASGVPAPDGNSVTASSSSVVFSATAALAPSSGLFPFDFSLASPVLLVGGFDDPLSFDGDSFGISIAKPLSLLLVLSSDRGRSCVRWKVFWGRDEKGAEEEAVEEGAEGTGAARLDGIAGREDAVADLEKVEAEGRRTRTISSSSSLSSSSGEEEGEVGLRAVLLVETAEDCLLRWSDVEYMRRKRVERCRRKKREGNERREGEKVAKNSRRLFRSFSGCSQ